MTAQRVWVIGLDGAPWSLIRPWAEAGELPNLRQLMREGAWGDLESTVQPLTPCAWSTFITGMNPGQHGLFDFTRRVPGSYRVEVVNASQRRGASLWRILSDAGRRVGVVNVPMTYPPEPVNGYLVAGLDTPGLHSPFTWPADLASEIVDRHIVAVSTAGVSHAEYLRRTLDAVDARFEVLSRLLRRESPDFLMKVIVETDAIQHCSWHLLAQPTAPGHDAILQVYRRVDLHLGELMGRIPPRTTLVLMSDHGQGPIDKVVYLDRWLARQGWLAFRGRNVRADLLQAAVGLGQRYLPPVVKARLRGQQAARAQVESTLRFGGVDWRRSLAFAWGNEGNINLNLLGREPEGIVRPGAEAERLTAEIVAALHELRDPDTGEPIVDRVYRREEIYRGPMTELAPDLLIRWRGDRYVAKTLYTRPGGELYGRRLIFGRAGSMHALEQTGTHTMQGICLFHGAQVQGGTSVSGAHLIDLAPTILHLMDVPIPEPFEGRVLPEILQGEQPGRGEEAGVVVDTSRGADRLKVMVIGLDGATWDLLGPLMDAGHLPNLAALRARSAWGQLLTTTPPFSATAWTTFATGANPGVHGIFDFWLKDARGRVPISSTAVGAPTLWQRLSQAGRRVAVINVPVTYPPQPVNGVVVSGMLTPGEDVSYTYPPELKAQLRVAAGGEYRADPHAAITQSKAFLHDALRWVEQRERAHLWLWQREPWDCFINVIQAPDPIQHYFWTFLQPGHPDYDAPGAGEFRELVLQVYRAIDRLIGRRIEALDGRTALILMSDHGAGEATHWFNLNRWLVQEGFMVLRSGRRAPLALLGAGGAGRLWNALRRIDVLGLRGRIGNLARQRLRGQVERALAPAIDWGHTLAYAGSASAEAIHVNLAGRESHGSVQPGAACDRVCAEIRQRLLALRGPDGSPVVAAVHARDALYRGRYLEQAPDLVLEVGHRPYLISENLASRELFEPIPFRAARGRHRPEGILLVQGPGAGRVGPREPAHIADLAPTILHLMGLPVPAELDGRVLVDWLDPALAAAATAAPVGPGTAVAPPSSDAGSAVYSPDDVALIEERLRSLGYLD